MVRRLATTFFALLSFILLLVSCAKYMDVGMITVKSPDGRIEVHFQLKELPRPYFPGNNMYYSVFRDGKQLLRDSPMGLNFGRDGNLMGNLMITQVRDTSMVDDFDTPIGKFSHVKAAYNQSIINLREKSIPAKSLEVIFRVYNDGVAFRYYLPEQEPDIPIPSAEHPGFLREFTIVDELTGFFFPTDEQETWALYTPVFQHNYENLYRRMKVSEITRDSMATLPMVITYNDGPAVCITEANLTNYPATYLNSAKTPTREIELALNSVLVPLIGEREPKARGKIPFITPWRVIMIAENPGKLIESNLLLCLNEPCAIDDVSWIKPGKASWDWWSGQVVGKRGRNVEVGGMKTATFVQYIDFAHQAGLQYTLIDAGWYGDHQSNEADITTSVPEMDIPFLVRHADSLGVKILLWLNWECVNKQMDQAFPLYEKWGVAGIKVDYMNRDDQEMVNFYHNVVKKAAEHHLVVDFHGAYKPAGIRRTWPNLITREGVLGLEYDKWSRLCDPEHDVTIPYTRMLCGPMDYTPGAFQNGTQKTFTVRNTDPMSQGTRCHQLAMYVVFESPLQMCSDSPVNYDKAKGLDFISLVPTVWDETRFLDGNIGDYIVLARKKGEVWYLGAMTDWDGRELKVPLDFLGGGKWKARVWADGKKAGVDAQDIEVSEMEVSSSDAFNVKMAGGGGLAAAFSPVR